MNWSISFAVIAQTSHKESNPVNTIKSVNQYVLTGGVLSAYIAGVNDHITEKILCIRELRHNGKHLEQKLLISQIYPNGYTAEVEEWRTVPRVYSDVVANPETTEFWKSVDWNKTNLELTAEHQINTQTICKYRRLVGHKSPPKSIREHKWDGVDWTQSNSQIAKMNGYTVAGVAQARAFLKKQPHNRRASAHLKVSDEQLASADWEWQTDTDLKRLWGISRERVRQLRLELKKPVCVLKHKSQVDRACWEWLFKNRAEIEGKSVYEVAAQMPGTQQRPRKLLIIKESGIKFNWSRRWKWGPESETPMNFDLPNLWLQRIWKRKDQNTVAAIRSLHFAPKPKWRAGGFASLYLSDPEFLTLIKAEVAKAQAAGVAVTEQEIVDAIEVKKAYKYHRGEPPAGAGEVLEGEVGQSEAERA
jgi:hypothetical protein